MTGFNASKAIRRSALDYEHVGLGAAEACARVYALVVEASQRPGDDKHLLSHLRQLAPCLTTY